MLQGAGLGGVGCRPDSSAQEQGAPGGPKCSGVSAPSHRNLKIGLGDVHLGRPQLAGAKNILEALNNSSRIQIDFSVHLQLLCPALLQGLGGTGCHSGSQPVPFPSPVAVRSGGCTGHGQPSERSKPTLILHPSTGPWPLPHPFTRATGPPLQGFVWGSVS
jgi:hypothetical protein